MKKLKSCPFCGGEAFVVNIRTTGEDPMWPFAERQVICEDCGCGVTFGFEAKTPNLMTDKEVLLAYKETVEAWNKRAEEKDATD